MNKQRGTTSVEFAIIAAALFITLFGVIEISRAFYIWNTVGEMTRRGARVAAVCPIGHAGVGRVALMGDPNGGNSSPLFSNMSTANIDITYLDEDGGATTTVDDAEHVRVQVQNYTHQLLIPFLPEAARTITMPAFTTTTPIESLGYIPDDGSWRCF